MAVATMPLVSRAFTEPKGYPTNYVSVNGVGEVPQFLNASSVNQLKEGSLLIGDRSGKIANCNGGTTTGCSRLCLNADPAKGTTDSTCITTWQDLNGSVSGSFLRRFADNSAGLDIGYSRLQGNSASGHLVSLIVEPNAAAGHNALRANGLADTNYAAQFGGTLFIGNKTNDAKLCLNDAANDGNPVGTCITKWSDLISTTTNIIRLQELRTSIAPVPDQGNAGVVGPVEVPSLILGQPATTLNPTLSCGDGLCSASEIGQCPLDC